MPTYLTEAQFQDYCSPVSRLLNENRPLRAWSLHITSVYKSGQAGLTTVLYENGNDLGAAEANLGAVDANGKWFYDSTIDTVYLFNDANSPNVDDIQAGEDHATYTAGIFQRASLLIDRELDPTHITPIPTDEAGNYEELIIQLAAYKTAELITAGKSTEFNTFYREQLTNIDDSGLLDRLKRGELKFANEINATSSSGTIEEVTLTGELRLVELRGIASGIPWDDIKVIITGAGDIGTATYSTFVADADTNTLQSEIQEEDEVIDGLFQSLAYGVQGRFAGSGGAEDDEWSVVIRGDSEQTSNPTIKSIWGGR